MKKAKRFTGLMLAAAISIAQGTQVKAEERSVKVDKQDIVILRTDVKSDSAELKAGRVIAGEMDRSIRTLLAQGTFKVSSEELLFNSLSDNSGGLIEAGGILTTTGRYDSAVGLYVYSEIVESFDGESASYSFEDYLSGGKLSHRNEYTDGWISGQVFGFDGYEWTNYFMSSVAEIAVGGGANTLLGDETLEWIGKYMSVGGTEEFEGQQCRVFDIYFTHEDYQKEIAGLPSIGEYMEAIDELKMVLSGTVYINAESGVRVGQSLTYDYYASFTEEGDWVELYSKHTLKTVFTDFGEDVSMPSWLPTAETEQ